MITGTNSTPPVVRVIEHDAESCGPRDDGDLRDATKDGLIGSKRPTGTGAQHPSFDEQYRRLVQAIIFAPLGGGLQAEGEPEDDWFHPDADWSQFSIDKMSARDRAELEEAIADART